MTSTTYDTRQLAIDDLFKDFYAIPEFQREYRWKAHNIDRFVGDIIGAFERGEEFLLGLMITCQHDGCHLVIDGQQRMTTLFLTLLSLRGAMDRGGASAGYIERQIRDIRLNPRTGEDEMIYRLRPSDDAFRAELEDLTMNGLDSANTGKSAARVAMARIDMLLMDEFGSDVTRIKQFHTFLCNKIFLLRTSCPNMQQAHSLFEVTNARGEPLYAFDLVKNRFYMHADRRDEAEITRIWSELKNCTGTEYSTVSRLFRYFFISHFNARTGDRMLTQAKVFSWFEENGGRIGLMTQPARLLRQVLDAARFTSRLSECKLPDGSVDDSLAFLKAISARFEMHHLPLLAISHMPSRDIALMTRALEKVAFCYQINRRSAKELEYLFSGWMEDLHSIKTTEDLQSFIDHRIAPTIESMRDSTREVFLRAVEGDTISTRRINAILARIAQYMEQEGRGRSVTFEDARNYTLEHILPQNPEAAPSLTFKGDWQTNYRKLGNLTLIESPGNGSAGDDDFQEKVMIYQTSGLLLTSLLAGPPAHSYNSLDRLTSRYPGFSQWTEKDIDMRQEILADIATEVWCQ
mgnify:CR=1 FL=1